MSTFSDTMRRLRTERNMTQEEFADLLGTKKQNISRYESGAVSPKISTAASIASKLGISLSELNGDEEDNERNPFPSNVRPISALHTQRVPMIGEVAAGQPIYAPEDCEVYVDSPVKCDAAITVRGDSMIPNYLDGDLVYIRCKPDVDDGQVAVVFMDDEAVIKHVYHEKYGLLLLSDNQDYAPIHATLEEYPNLRIFGVPVGFTRMYKDDPLRKIKKGFH